MADRNLMTPSSANFSGLLGNGIIYRVPTFQRDYSWKEDQWASLLDDIKIAIKSGKDHYMGAVVVQKKGEKNFIIIDGQQRITTLSLLALAVIRNIQDLIDKEQDADANKERISELRRGFLGQRDPGSLLYSSKLSLNENNDAFYQSHLLQLREPRNERSLPASDRLMWQAYQYLYRQVQLLYPNNPTGEDLANFLNKIIGDKLMFIKIEVEDELSAYTLFETLNYRGVDLTVTDLLKNYLFAQLAPTDLNIAKESWKKISNTVGLEKFPTFLRHFWLSRNEFVREEQLFKIVRNSITTVEKVFELLNSLESNASYYMALQDPYSSEWQGDRAKRKRIREFKLFGVKMQLPMLMIAKEKFSDPEYDSLLRLLSVVAFRYNVIGDRQANVMEDIYSRISLKIFNEEITTARQAFNELKQVYISDKDFKFDFSTTEIPSTSRSKKRVRYILYELENHLAHTDRDFEDDPGTIEHILPENATEDWETTFQSSIQSNFIYKLGNYTLLEADKNRAIGTQLFPEKKIEYATSQYSISKLITSNEWNPSTLELRQQRMADWASACWRVSYAD